MKAESLPQWHIGGKKLTTVFLYHSPTLSKGKQAPLRVQVWGVTLGITRPFDQEEEWEGKLCAGIETGRTTWYLSVIEPL